MIYRSEKGSPLTFQELDGNFQELFSMIKALEQVQEKAPYLPEALKEVRQEGEIAAFIGTYGTDLGRIVLPKIAPNPRGKWLKNEYYNLHDWVVFTYKTYACIKAHVAADFDADRDKWCIVIDPVIADHL